ncbi:little elongation complex subunit 1 isoform X2 [Electrophorus electricus]|nr:little elongation complex subunit 1 isoform X2 [Electrophorus electricus]
MKTAVKSYHQKSEEVDSLRAENAKALVLKQKLEDNLKKAEDTAESQSLESMKLRSEKKSLEEDLQKTRDSLRTCQQAAEEVESLRLQNAKTLILKCNLENQLLAHEDRNLQQNDEIRDLKCDNSRLAEALLKTQEKLQKLEKEFNKEKTNISIQTEREPEVDKAKVRMLLQQLWQCVELSQTTEKLDLTDLPDSQHLTSPPKHRFQRAPFQILSGSLIRKRMPQSAGSSPPEGTHSQTPGSSTSKLEESPGKSKFHSLFQEQNSPRREHGNRKTGCKKKRSLESEEPNESSTLMHKTTEVSTEGGGGDQTGRDGWGNSTDLWEILDSFRPLPSALSPMSCLSNEQVERDVIPSLLEPKEGSLSSNKDCEKSTDSTESKPLHSPVAVQSSFSDSPLKTGHLCSEIPLVPLYTDKVVLENFSSECQDMEVEELCKGKEKFQNSAIGAESLQNGCEKDYVQIKPAWIITKESHLSSMEDHMNPVKSQSNASSEIPSTLCSEVISKGLDSGQQLMNTDHKCPDTDDGLENQRSLTPEEIRSSCTPEQIQSLTPDDTTLRRDSKIHDSSCTKVDGVSYLESSKDEESSAVKELFCLDQKVRGVCSRPSSPNSSHHLNSVGTHDPESVEEQISVSQAQRTSPKTEAEGAVEDSSATRNPEDERKNVIVEGKIITENICQPAIPEENTAEDGQQVSDAHHHYQEEQEVHGALGSNVENVGGHLVNGLKEHLTKAEDQITVNPQEAHPPRSVAEVKSLMLPGLDKGENLSPLTASRDALSSTPSPESIRRVRTEMGPPLPPAVMPLTATPPKFVKHQNPLRLNVQLPSWLPAEGPCSPVQQPTESSSNSSFEDETKMSPCLNTPSPSSLGVPTFPLQFGSETPKHAVPVPGRLPSSALSSSSPTVSQESSMQLLDTMYPELSAQARTLTILRWNVGLNRATGETGASPQTVSQISGNKTINSSSTAFTKTEQKGKRMGVNVLLPKSAKRLRLDACSPGPAKVTSPLQQFTDAQPSSGTDPTESRPANSLWSNNQEPRTECNAEVKGTEKPSQISDAIEKIQTSCFDILPVIKSHVFLGRISKIPVLRDEEKSVLADFCSDQSSAEELMLAILSKMKLERAAAKADHLHALCRVYVGLCRHRGDHQKVHALAYHLLKEDFPEAAKMILFLVTTWPTVMSHEGPLCKAINTVSKMKAEGEVLDYLTVYLHWDRTPSGDLNKMVTSTLKALLEDGDLTFQKHDRYGDDLCPRAWEYIFTVDLLCAHLGWKWTLENIIGKELWPVMNAWVTQPRHQQTPVRDVCVAAVLRLIGRLGQLGIKEKLCEFLQNVSKPINLFAKHGIAEGVPWEVQLSAVYAIYDLAPISPKDALDSLASWRGDTTRPVPPAVTSCITQIGSLCRQIKL